MKHWIGFILAAPVVMHAFAATLHAEPGPFDGKSFRGRIAYSADGNYNDEDDWAASPVALAIFARCGVKDKLVHFDYNCILPKTDPKWEREHALSVLGAAERFGYSASVFFDCRKDLDAAVESIENAVNASSAENPLYFILAGPMEVPFLGLEKSDPGKRRFVYCVSHNVWNDGYASKDLVKHNKRHVIPTGVTWIQITDQNPRLSTSRYGRPANEQEWRPWLWLRDSENAECRFLWDRMQATTRADCSDAGMAYFLMTGNEQPTTDELKALLDGGRIPAPIDARTTVRLEAENFQILENFQVEYVNDRTASQRLSVKPIGPMARIRTRFDEPYTADFGRYDVEVRYFDASGGQCQLALSVNGVPAGLSWQASRGSRTWQSYVITGVSLARGDEVTVEVRGGAGDDGKLDFMALHLQERDAAYFVVPKNETLHHPRSGPMSRRYMWACAMAGVHTIEAYHHADRSTDATLREDGLVAQFMERTDVHRMKPRDDLAAASAKWVLADPGHSYVAYSYDCSGPMGIKDMTAGTYDLLWFDTVTGNTVTQSAVEVVAGDATWPKPATLGREIALCVKRR